MKKEEILILQQSKENFRDLANFLPQAVFEFNKKMIITFANKIAFKTFGYTRKDFRRGLLALCVISPKDRLRAISNIRKVLRGEEIGGIEYTALKKNSKEFPCTIYVNRIIKEGKIWGLRGILIDISTLKKTEEEKERYSYNLRERVKELRCIYEFSKLVAKRNITLKEIIKGLVSILPSGWQYPDIACARIIFEKEKFKTDNFKASRWKQSADIKVHGKTAGKVEVRYLEKRPKDYEGPFLKEERDLLNIITERLGRIIGRQKTEDDITNAYEMTYNILEKSPFGIYVVNKEGNIIYANPASFKISGDAPKQFKSINVFRLPTYKKIGFDEKIRSALKGKSFFLGPMEYTSHYGKKTTIRNFIGMPLGEKEEKEVIVFIEDVTDLENAKKELEKAYNELKLSQEELIQSAKMATVGQMASGMAHEINNPLFAILGEAKMLFKEKQDQPDVREGLKIILEQGERIGGIIKSLLDFSRREKANLAPLDINTVVNKTLFLLRYQIDKEKIEISKDFSSDMPYIMGDEGKLEEAFLIIIINAVQAMEDGGKLTIKTRLEKVSDEERKKGGVLKDYLEVAAIEFKDTGKGMDEKTLMRIFEPFFTTKPKNTGLGLSICSQIIQVHKGDIEVYSQSGKGSTFIIKLPVRQKGEK